jgi:hypothetical protein
MLTGLGLSEPNQPASAADEATISKPPITIDLAILIFPLLNEG